jgi:hypothetical protein
VRSPRLRKKSHGVHNRREGDGGDVSSCGGSTPPRCSSVTFWKCKRQVGVLISLQVRVSRLLSISISSPFFSFLCLLIAAIESCLVTFTRCFGLVICELVIFLHPLVQIVFRNARTDQCFAMHNTGVLAIRVCTEKLYRLASLLKEMVLEVYKPCTLYTLKIYVLLGFGGEKLGEF